MGGHQSASGYQRKIIDHVRHPRYSFNDDKAYDFLLLKLNRPIPNPQLIKLNQNPNYPLTDEMFTVIGFGFMKEDGSRTAQYLQEVQVPHIPDCSPYYRKSSVQDHIAFCAGHEDGGKDSCQADSGGALLNPKTGVQVGLVSWGRGCARPESPGVYARVSTVYSWIQHQICELSAVPPAHCTQIRVDVTMDDFPFETEWAILDNYGHEMVVSRRGKNRQPGLTSTVLNVPVGMYRFYMSDKDGICCSHGQGGIAIYGGSTTNNQLLQHDGKFQNDLVLSFMTESSTSDSSSGSTATAAETTATTPQPYNPATQPYNPTAFPDSNTDNIAVVYTENGHGVTSPGSSLSFSSGGGNNNPTKPVPATTLSPTQTVPSNSVVQEELVVGSTLRIEIFYDMQPQETGWFLVNTDTYQEIYASKFDSNRRIPSNAGNALSLVVEEFEELEPGPYWFLIADAEQNGICCNRGAGYIRIVQLRWTTTSAVAQRDHAASTFMEEHVLWQHNGKFTDYAEVHLQLE